MGKRRLYVRKDEIDDVVSQITQQQIKANRFVNVEIRPYKGKKYDPDQTAVVIIG